MIHPFPSDLVRAARLAAAAVAIAAAPAPAAAAAAPNPGVRIAGVSAPTSFDGDTVPAPGPAGRAAPGPDARAGVPGAAVGPRSVLVLRVYYDGEGWPSPEVLDAGAYGTDAVQRRITGADTSARAMYDAQSDGKVSLTGIGSPDADVSPWLTFSGAFPTDAGGRCDADAVRLKAQHEADKRGVPWRTYDHVVILFPALPSSVCSWAGLGQISGAITWVNGFYDEPGEERVDSGVVAHEIGHNLGVAHAASLACTETSSDPDLAVLASTACTLPKSADAAGKAAAPITEYGDPFDLMGTLGYSFPWRGTELMSTWHRAQVLELPANAQQVVATAGTYDLHAASDTGGVRLLTIPRSGTGSTTMAQLALEYRPAGATFDHWTADTLSPPGGVLVRLTPSLTSSMFSYLLDGTPATRQQYAEAGSSSAWNDQFRAAWRDAALGPGRSLLDQATGIRITVQSISGGIARVQLSGGPLSAAAVSPAATPTPAPTPAAPAPTPTPAPPSSWTPGSVLSGTVPGGGLAPEPPAMATAGAAGLPAFPGAGPLLAAPSLAFPVKRRGKLRLTKTRRITVSFPGAERIAASYGSRWYKTGAGERVTFRLPGRAVRKSTIRFRAIASGWAEPKTASLRIRKRSLRFRVD